MIDSADLVGIEIGQKSVSALVLSSDARSIVRFADTPIAGTLDGTEGFPDISGAIETLWRELGLDLSSSVRAAVSVSHIHAGIGSGPSIESWIDGLGGDLNTPLIRSGERFEGVSYFPKEFLDNIRAGFAPLDTQPERVELAPISAARCFAPKSTCSFTVDSGVSWQARVHSGLVLEAMVAEEPAEHGGLAITKGSEKGLITSIHGLELTDELLASLRINVSEIAVAAGAALGLVDRPSGNLLEGTASKATTQVPATHTGPAADSPDTAATPPPLQHDTSIPSPVAASPITSIDAPPTVDAEVKPLPPHHVSAGVAAATDVETTTQAAQPAPTPLEPGQQRAGFEPSEDEIIDSTTESPAVTPAFLPPSGSVANAEPEVESSVPRAVTTLNLPGRNRRTQEKKSNRPSTIEAQRPRIDRHEDEFPAEPFAGKTQSSSTYNLKLLTAALSVLIVLGLLLFFFGPN